MTSPEEAGRLLSKTEAELLADVSETLFGRGSAPPSIEVRLTAARGWLAENAAGIKKCVCTNRVQELVRADAGPVEICVALGDLLLDQFAHIAPLTLAALIVKIGVRSYCEKAWAALAVGGGDAGA
jgi:hypothetical protein